MKDFILSFEDKKEKIFNKTSLIYHRVKKYPILENKLKDFKVHYPDDRIVLDAHDFNLNFNQKLDFITFDDTLYEAIKQINEFNFNKVKGRFDYL